MKLPTLSIRRSFLLAMLVFVDIAEHTQGRGQENDEHLKQRFLKEAPIQWKEYTERSGDLQGVCIITTEGTLQGSKYRFHIEYKTNEVGRLVKSTTQSFEGKGKASTKEEVFGYNSAYAFSLHRKTTRSPWVLTELMDRSKTSDLGEVTVRINSFLNDINTATRLRGESLTELLSNPTFQIAGCRRIRHDKKDLVEVSFVYNTEGNKGKHTITGKLLLDPERYWSLHSVSYRVTGDFITGTQSIQIEQSGSTEDLPPLVILLCDIEVACVPSESYCIL